MKLIKTPASSPADAALAKRTLYGFVMSAERLPFSFSLDGKRYRGLPENYDVNIEKCDGYTRRVYRATYGNVRISADCRVYDDFGGIEWTVGFENTSDIENSPLLSDLLAADMSFSGEDGAVYTCNGDFNSFDGYVTTKTPLRDGDTVSQAPVGGRPCDRAFPYQRLTFDGFGFNIAIGWPGQWSCRYTGFSGGVAFSAGQEEFSAVLRPGEYIRTPLMAIIAFDGDIERGINVWRRFYLHHIMPHSHGDIVHPFLHGTYAPPGTIEFSEATEENQRERIRRAKDAGIVINLWWLDAGWYKCKKPDGKADWWGYVGNWVYDEDRFPNGLAPLGDECRSRGMDFLTWFEAERVTAGCPVVSEHPEWLLHDPERPRVIMLNLGIPDCADYLARVIGDVIENSHITVYRQDYNFCPLPVWRSLDREGRRGIAENLYVQGYLHFWDSLHARFPDLIIDSCASGGRRNDLETMRRAVVMHQTDTAYGNHPVMHSFFQTLYTWLPYFRGFGANWETENGEYIKPEYYNKLTSPADNFQLLASFAPMMSVSNIVRDLERYSKSELEYAASVCKLFYRVAPKLETYDFYALTPYHKERTKWTAWQFDKPENRDGLIEVIRNNAAEEESLTVVPRFAEDGEYLFTEIENNGESFVYRADGEGSGEIKFTQPVRSVRIWEYKPIK